MSNQVYVFSVIFRSNASPSDAHITEAISRMQDAVSIQDYIIQGERGASGNYHLQGYVRTEDKVRARTFEKRLIPPDWCTTIGVKPCSAAGRKALKHYCMKADTRVLAPVGKRPIYLGQDLECMRKPFKWQAHILNLIKKPPNDRKIVWICNEDGCAGKSVLMKYCHYHRLAKRVPLGTASQIKASVIAMGPSRAYFVDLPRVRGSQERQAELFSALESLKGGFIVSAMYGKTEELLMLPPHLIILSNELPDLRLASMDRWEILMLKDKHSELSQMSQE